MPDRGEARGHSNDPARAIDHARSFEAVTPIAEPPELFAVPVFDTKRAGGDVRLEHGERRWNAQREERFTVVPDLVLDEPGLLFDLDPAS